ncbi:SDR family oxidoreductase [Cryptosporangium sp. NPDC051539]|uniref:SDR family oxidoreductase n=1 Tax=Cryptosporangium sp. NPDC051539 TaxID=3363962 RepID=UPI0037ACC653
MSGLDLDSHIDPESAIAVIGMAGRFAGATTVDQLWANLMAGRGGLRELSEEELLEAGVNPALLASPDYVRVGGGVDDVDRFDAGMFGVNRREAELMDPQHRFFLECCWEVLERSGYPPMAMPGRVGVFAGCGYPDYLQQVARKAMAEPGGSLMLAVGTERDSLASLVSYKLDLRGPSITVQTFCSTSLVAVHLAAQSLLNFECEVALAGGAFLPLPQGGYLCEDGGILSPDGEVRAFDAAANGSIIGSGVSVVALKRLADALEDDDDIEAVILGSAVNNDGRACAGYTAPGVDGQAAVMQDALSYAGVKAETVDYLECHGTGTMLGDSVELAAAARAYKGRTTNPIVLGSIKPSLGHLDRASGTTGLIRTAMALRRGVLPAVPNYQNPNPALAAVRDRFTVLTEPQPWPGPADARRAGVSSFGLGGTNAHVVLQAPPKRADRPDQPGPHLLVLSARDATALEQATSRLGEHLAADPELRIADVAFTLQQSRTQFPRRRAIVCADRDDAIAALADPSRWTDAEATRRNPAVALDLTDADAVPATWWADLLTAVQDRLDAEGPSPASDKTPRARAVSAVREGFARIGVRFADEAAPDAPVVRLGPDAAEQPASHWLQEAVAVLWQAGVDVRWGALHRRGARRVPLPTYPFQRRSYWIAPSEDMFEPPVDDGRVADLDRWTYQPAWQPEPRAIVDRTDSVREAGPWLVIAAEPAAGALARRLTELGAAVITARPGDRFAEEAPDLFTLRPDEVADYRRLIGGLDAPPRTVVHALGLDAERDPDGPALAVIEALGAMTAALAEQTTGRNLDLLVVTEEAVSIAGSVPHRPAWAAVDGLLPSIAQENPGWRCRHVDVTNAAAQVDGLLEEAVVRHEGPVALRGTGRWVRSYQPLPLPEPTGGRPAPGTTVLITGGLGHVGLILTRHLALRRRCRVVITARTALPEPAEWPAYLEQHQGTSSRLVRLIGDLAEITAAGGEVLVLPAEVSSAPQMRAAVEAAVARFGPIGLVVHAAGVSDGEGFGPAHMVSRDGVESHLRAKVGGFNALRAVLADQSYTGITLSSLSAVLGGLALGPYAAANAVLDACAVAERNSGGRRWVTVDWDTWRPRPDAEAAPGHDGAYDMAPEEAVEIFERAVGVVDQVEHLVISTGSLDARLARWVVRPGQDDGVDEDEDDIRDPRPDLLTPYVEPAEGTERALADIWARVLRLDKVGADDDFFRLGGNSLVAIELIAKVRRDLQVPVPVAAMLGFPTVRGLAAQIRTADADE